MTAIYVTERGKAMLTRQFALHTVLFPTPPHMQADTLAPTPRRVRAPELPSMAAIIATKGGGNAPSSMPAGGV